MAAAVRTPLPFMAISLQSPPNPSRTSVMPPAKSDMKAAGRRLLDKYRAEKTKQGESKPVKRADSNGELVRRESAPKQEISAPRETLLPAPTSSRPEVEPEASSSDSNVHSFRPPSPTFSSGDAPSTSAPESFIPCENHVSDRLAPLVDDADSEKENLSLNVMNHSQQWEPPRSRDSLFAVPPFEPVPPEPIIAPVFPLSRLTPANESNESFVPGPVNSFSSRHNEFAPFKVDHPPPRSNRDDFAALEQHIEDLTQEKFSLQRGLEKARGLIETLTQANSALTEDYNQQGAKVDELKDELGRFQEIIRSQEIVIHNLKAEKDKTLQENTVAVERARTFAAEVVALEEKHLKRLSQELKFQKEVESLRAELESSRKQALSIEKDRLNAVSLNDALQEEKKLLLVRIREAAAAPAAAPAPVVVSREDASTSTDDLVIEDEASVPAAAVEEETTSYPTSIPPDHLGVIESINALVTELGQEKNEILRALRNESNAVAQLKAENVELSQRLERQTQQLELAFAQNLARAGVSSPSPGVPQASEVEFDEGDEVVDRVLGWIMRLFPGKRGASKQL